MPYAEYKARQNGKQTKNDLIQKDIDITISVSPNMKYFEKVMKQLGYEFQRRRKYEYVVHPMVPNGLRLIHLGEEYTLEAIHGRIRKNRYPTGVQFGPQDDISRFFETPPWEYIDLCEMYVNFVAIIDIVKERRQFNYELFRTLWEEELIFDKRVEEQNFLLDVSVKTNNCSGETPEIQLFRS